MVIIIVSSIPSSFRWSLQVLQQTTFLYYYITKQTVIKKLSCCKFSFFTATQKTRNLKQDKTIALKAVFWLGLHNILQSNMYDDTPSRDPFNKLLILFFINTIGDLKEMDISMCHVVSLEFTGWQ